MPNILVTINDETGAGKVVNSSQIEFPESLVSVAQIIERRVKAEVARFNEQRSENFYGLVQPVDAEQTLNGFRKQTFKPIDAEKQIATAKQAFQNNGFFMLIDNLQAESLGQTFLLHPKSTISFVKLTPLVGG